MRVLLGRAAVMALVATLGNVASPDIAQAQDHSPPRFNKQAFAPNNLPLTGSPQAGDTIKFVLSYWYGNAAAGSVSIEDQLSGGLTYVNPSIVAPPGWTWTPGPGPLPPIPYGAGNHEVYTNTGPGPATSFQVPVPVSNLAAVGVMSGDGSLPIPVGNEVWGVFHHALVQQARIMCWDLLTLVACNANNLPYALGSDLTTPTLLKHVVRGSRIFFPAARDGGTSKVPGVGCFDAATKAACTPAFIDFAVTGFPNVQGDLLGPHFSGLVEDPNNPSRVFLTAKDRVGCIDVAAGAECASPWNAAATISTGSRSNTGTFERDMLVGKVSGEHRLYVHHPDQTASKISCFKVVNGSADDGSACGTGWPVSVPLGVGDHSALTPVPDASGTGITHVCLHFRNYSGATSCFNASSGASDNSVSGLVVNNVRVVLAAFQIPNTNPPQVLYPAGSTAQLPQCRQFPANANTNNTACSPAFTPGWGAGQDFRDYGYAVDPANEACLLGLGDGGATQPGATNANPGPGGRPWRFTRDGGFGDERGCTARIVATLDTGRFYCASKPGEVTWTSVIVNNRPPELMPDASRVKLSVGATVIFEGSLSQAESMNRASPNGPVTLEFTPRYNGSLPRDGYSLQVIFTANTDPQICYQATVKCGDVSNKASLRVADRSIDRGVNLGTLSCHTGLLKVCKVAGLGIEVGTQFAFTAGSHAFNVPAGPAPGGTCVVGPSFGVGSAVTLAETIPAGGTVSSITVAPPGRMVGAPDLAGGKVGLTIGSGVTEVTFANKRAGFLEICKASDTPTTPRNYTFSVNPGGLGPFVVPAGTCSPAIEIAAGTVSISEAADSNTIMHSCSTFPAARQGACNPAAQTSNQIPPRTSVVTVVPGDISTQTIATITNGTPSIPNVAPPKSR